MNKLATGMTISTVLFLGVGCTSLSTSHQVDSSSQVIAQEHHNSKQNQNSQHHGSGQTVEHKNHGSNESIVSTTHAKLTLTSPATTENLTPLVINVENHQNLPVKQFERFQEKLMHLIIVSNDLQFFSHIHPQFQGDGRFTVETKFPFAGSYTLFSDYKPQGESEQVSVMSTNVAGKMAPIDTRSDTRRNKTVSNTEVSLSFDQPEVKAGKKTTIDFNLQQAGKNKPVTNLQPYLGEKGHLVILKQSSPLTKASYIHAHANQNEPLEKVSFTTSFPESGKYKLWGQFNLGGEIIIADFWVNVQ